MFVWQIPHFFAIAWMYREDYDRAGFRMLSSGDETGARSRVKAFSSACSCFIAGVPTYLGLTSAIYLIAAFALGAWFTAAAMHFHSRRTPRAARSLFLTSIIYLPLLLLALVITKT